MQERRKTMGLAKGLTFVSAGLMTSAVLYGCASFPSMEVAPPNGAPSERGGGASGPFGMPEAGRGGRGGRGAEDILRSANTEPQNIPGAVPTRPTTPEASPDALAAVVPDEPIGAVLTPQPVGAFLDIVFSSVL